MYALVDGNNFYVSCERVFQPNLNGKAVVVLSNNDGVIISRSNEAKDLGITMAPVYQYAKLIQEKAVKVFSSNYPLYGDMSNRMMNILQEFTPDIEIYSIDEAFLEFKGFDNFDLNDYGLKIRKKILKDIGIPTSIGIAPTKSLAKAANKIAKKFSKQTNSVYVIDNEEKIRKALKWINVEDIWGIGRRNAKKLNSAGVYKGIDFVNLSDAWIKKNMNITALRLKKDLLGEPHIFLEDVKTKKNILTSRSFAKSIIEYKDLKERISSFAFSCAEKLRKEKLVTSTILVFVSSNKHKSNRYVKSILVKLPYATNSSIDIVKYSISGLEKIFKKGIAYKKAGISALNLISEKPEQLSLFETKNRKHEKLMKVIDEINAKSGKHLIKISSQNLEKTWVMKQEHLSKRYTTNFDDIIQINADK